MKKLAEISLDERVARMEEEVNGDLIKEKMIREAKQYRESFVDYLHTGNVTNDLKIGRKEDGGYLCPEETDRRLIEKLEEKGIMRNICTVMDLAHNTKIPGATEHSAACWVEEGGQLQFTEEHFDQRELVAHKLAVGARVTEELLEDADFDIEGYLIESFAKSISEVEDEAFFNGNSDGKPHGILIDAEVGTEVSDLDGDAILDLIYSLRKPYRDKSVFVMSDDAFSKLHKIKSLAGKYAWQENFSKKAPYKLMGYPVYVSNAMPSILPGNCPIAFGDFSYYWVADRGRISFTRLSERFADEGCVGYKSTHRVDGRLVLTEAVKTLKIVA